jgi:hypothetical protein
MNRIDIHERVAGDPYLEAIRVRDDARIILAAEREESNRKGERRAALLGRIHPNLVAYTLDNPNGRNFAKVMNRVSLDVEHECVGVYTRNLRQMVQGFQEDQRSRLFSLDNIDPQLPAYAERFYYSYNQAVEDALLEGREKAIALLVELLQDKMPILPRMRRDMAAKAFDIPQGELDDLLIATKVPFVYFFSQWEKGRVFPSRSIWVGIPKDD